MDDSNNNNNNNNSKQHHHHHNQQQQTTTQQTNKQTNNQPTNQPTKQQQHYSNILSGQKKWPRQLNDNPPKERPNKDCLPIQLVEPLWDTPETKGVGGTNLARQKKWKTQICLVGFGLGFGLEHLSFVWVCAGNWYILILCWFVALLVCWLREAFVQTSPFWIWASMICTSTSFKLGSSRWCWPCFNMCYFPSNFQSEVIPFQAPKGKIARNPRPTKETHSTGEKKGWWWSGLWHFGASSAFLLKVHWRKIGCVSCCFSLPERARIRKD